MQISFILTKINAGTAEQCQKVRQNPGDPFRGSGVSITADNQTRTGGLILTKDAHYHLCYISNPSVSLTNE